MTYRSQAGNVLFLILIAVALFAALSYAVTSSSRSGGGGVEKDKAKLVASQMVQWASSMEQGITRMKLINRCTNAQLSFEAAPFYGTDSAYLNPNSPADKRCFLFHPNGGGVADMRNEFEEKFEDSYVAIGAGSAINQVGISGCGDSTCTDMYMLFDMRGDYGNAVCAEINKLSKYSDIVPPPVTTFGVYPPKFKGVFAGSHVASNPLFVGKNDFCHVYSTNPNNNFFYYILVAR